MSQHLVLVPSLIYDYDAGIAFFTGAMGLDLPEDADMGDGKRWVRVGPRGAQTQFLRVRSR